MQGISRCKLGLTAKSYEKQSNIKNKKTIQCILSLTLLCLFHTMQVTESPFVALHSYDHSRDRLGPSLDESSDSRFVDSSGVDTKNKEDVLDEYSM